MIATAGAERRRLFVDLDGGVEKRRVKAGRVGEDYVRPNGEGPLDIRRHAETHMAG